MAYYGTYPYKGNNNGGWRSRNGRDSRGLVWKRGDIRKEGGKPFWYATVGLSGGKYAVIKFYENSYNNSQGMEHHAGSIVIKSASSGSAPSIGPWFPPMGR